LTRLLGPLFPLGQLGFLLRQNSEVLRLYAFVGERESLCGQPTSEYFANGGRSARHPSHEAPIVKRRQLILREHDLQTFYAAECNGKIRTTIELLLDPETAQVAK
jgi:hypothetical protein